MFNFFVAGCSLQTDGYSSFDLFLKLLKASQKLLCWTCFLHTLCCIRYVFVLEHM